MIKIALFVLALCVLAAQSTMTPPKWPAQYTISGNMTLPTWPATIVEQFTIWTDTVNNQQRIDYYNGRNSAVSKFATGNQKFYVVNPRLSSEYCWIVPPQDMQGATLVPVLPDISTWTYAGNQSNPQVCPSVEECVCWQTNVTTLNVTAIYQMYVTPAGVPQTLIMRGYDFVFGSHPDLYVMTISSFTPSVSSSAFNAPSACASQSVPAENSAVVRRAGFQARARMADFLVFHPPAEESLNDEFELFKFRYHKFYLSPSEHAQRRRVYKDNLRFIEEHNANAEKHGFTVGMNHLGDWTAEERKLILHPSRVTVEKNNAAGELHASGNLPASVDWVALGKVQPPKDQGICGSCWTFGSAGALETAWAIKKNNLPNLSEQQIVNCAWSPNPNDPNGDQGCGGGFASGAYDWIMSNGGISLESSTPYLMQDDYCDATVKDSGVTVSAYINVTAFDESALQSAIVMGSVAIAIDAAHPSFEFYQSGVYYEPKCKSGLDALDHEVLAVGYGTDSTTGAAYYLVKNSWSSRWGHQGFIRMSRNRGNNCGVASQATLPIVQ